MSAHWFAPDIPFRTNCVDLSHLQRLQAEAHYHTDLPIHSTAANAPRHVDCRVFDGCDFHMAHAKRLGKNTEARKELRQRSMLQFFQHRESQAWRKHSASMLHLQHYLGKSNGTPVQLLQTPLVGNFARGHFWGHKQ